MSVPPFRQALNEESKVAKKVPGFGKIKDKILDNWLWNNNINIGGREEEKFVDECAHFDSFGGTKVQHHCTTHGNIGCAATV